MNYKMVVSDYDDTLRVEGVGVSQKNIEVLKRYVAMGGIFAVATGRTLLSIKPFVDSLGGISDYIIPFNGAVIYDIKKQDNVIAHIIKNEIAVEILKDMEEHDMEVQLYDEHHIWVKNMSDRSYYYERESGCKLIPIGDKLSNFLAVSAFDPIKLLGYCDPNKTRQYVDYFNEKYKGVAQFVFSKPYLLECVSISAGKFNSIIRLAESLNIKREEIFAIGDSMNDIEMIEKAGFGVAMGNALDEVKGKAKAVARDCKEDGVAYAVLKYVLEEEI